MWLLAGLAAARTFRAFAVDGIGDPIRNRFNRAMDGLHGPPSDTRRPRRRKLANSLAEGAYCVYCLPFWITLAWVGTGLAWSDTWPWQLAAGSFGASYVVSHVLARLEGDDIDDAD